MQQDVLFANGKQLTHPPITAQMQPVTVTMVIGTPLPILTMQIIPLVTGQQPDPLVDFPIGISPLVMN